MPGHPQQCKPAAREQPCKIGSLGIALNSNPFREPLEQALRLALEYLNGLDRAPAGASASLEELRGKLARPLSEGGMAADEVLRELVEDVRGGIMGSAGGRFFGWVMGGAVPGALAADWMTAAWDQNAATYTCSPGAAVVEEVVGGWLKELLGLPQRASFALVTGCQMAHVTCLTAARHALLAGRGWDVEQRGLHGAPQIRILTSRERHTSVERAVQLLGIGRAQMIDLPVNGQGQLLTLALETALRGSRAPTVVVLQAGDLNIGAFDDMAQLIPLAKRFRAWVHIDGAFGLWARVSERFREHLNGVNGADSWATDGHKWLNVPYDSGYAFVADSRMHRESLSVRAAYLSHVGDARDQIDWNVEWSRRARGFATYAAIRELGRQGIAAIVERCCDHASEIVRGIGELPGAEVVWDPTLNQGLVRFRDTRPDATGIDHDARTDAIVAAIQMGGEALFSGTTWRGRRAMRISVCGWQTSGEDVRRAVAAVAAALV